jgi:PAS domain S-box-containing protein
MRKMLVVDDEEDNLRVLSTLFGTQGFSVLMAKNGLEALEIARKNPPNIVISDILMPVMDGFKLCREWKTDNLLKKIPFVFFTGAFTDRRDEELAASLDADLFILKPKRSDELFDLINGVLAKFEPEPAEAESEGKTSRTEILEEYSAALFRKLEDKVKELEAADQAIRESERNYRSFFENAAEGILRTTRQGQILMANPAFVHMLGYDSFDDLAASITDVSLQVYVDPEDCRRLVLMLERNRAVSGFETRFRRKDGGIIWVNLNMRAVVDERGGLPYFEGITQDITDRKQDEEAFRNERQRFLTLAENAPFGMLLMDGEGRFVYINQMFREIFGYDLEEIHDGREWFAKVYPDPDYRRTVISSWIDDLRTAGPGQRRPRIYSVTCKDGKEKTINFVPVQLLTGETIMSCEDITERKQIERAIEESRTTLRSLIDATSETLMMIDSTGKILVVNKTASQRLGKSVNQVIGTCLYDYFHPGLAARRKRELDRVFTTGKPVHFTDERTGRIYQSYAYPVFDDDGRVEKAVVFSSDTTERAEAQRQVRLNESRLQSLYEIFQYSSQNTRDILKFTLDKCITLTGSRIGYIYFYDEGNRTFTLSTWSKGLMKEGTVLEPMTTCNLDETGIWGEAVRQRKPVVINNYQEACHPWIKECSDEGLEKLHTFLAIPVIIDDRIVLVVGVANKETDYDQSDIRQLTLLMDSVWKIVRHREAEKALSESEEKYRNIFKNASEGIFQITPSGRFISVNPALSQMAGYASPEEMMETIDDAGKRLYTDPEERGRFINSLKTNGLVRNYIVLHNRKDGSTFWASVNARAVKNTDGDILYHEGTLEDITERRVAEERLREVLSQLEEKNSELYKAYEKLKESQKKTIQSEKMASIGQLAAGVAHEINNPAGFVISNLNSLQKYVERLHEFYVMQETAMEDLVQTDGKQRETILDRIKTNKRSMKIDYILEDIGNLIRESLDGADRVKKIVQDLKSFSRVDDTAYTMADVHAVLETTLNIVWNELKYRATLRKEYGAIPSTRCNPGQLSQVFMNLLVNAAHAISKYGEITIRTWHDTDHIFVSISDTGSGIPEQDIKKLFDPFFTTKEAGRGTGLGLSISYDIMTKHNGEILVKSEVGKGTTMTVKIPILGVENEIRNSDIDVRR